MTPPLSAPELERAWQRVAENAGCAGADGETIAAFARRIHDALPNLAAQLNAGLYQSHPLLRIRVEKHPGSSQSRVLLVPAVIDRIAQTALARRLSKSYEEEFLETSFAYRPHRGVDQAIARIRQWRDRGYEWLLDADIRSFFDQVSWTHLLALLQAAGEPPAVLDLIDLWLRLPYWDGLRLRSRSRGLPQGSPLSPLLANLYLQPMDARLSQQAWKLIRYADDFVVLTQTEAEARAAEAMVREELNRVALMLHPEKTRITSFGAGFRFLGVHFHKDEIWVPWKGEKKQQGRVLAMARPMPPSALAHWFARARPTTALGEAIEAANARWAGSPKALTGSQSPAVAYLYITEQGATLRKSGDRFLVEREGQTVLDIPYHKLEHILIFGNVQVTTQAIGELLEKGVDLSYFTWQGVYRGGLAPRQGTNVEDRLRQYAFWKDPARCLAAARAVVANKIRNSRATLISLARDSSRGVSTVAAELAELQAAEARAAEMADLDALRGMEGLAARTYFTAWGKLNPSGFVWTGRSAHPPKDPLNGLMSLVYTLVTQELGSLIEAEGLEVALGFLHAMDRGRPSLALDLVEAFRAPVADRLVFQFLLRDWISAADFSGVLLTEGGLKRVIEKYEQWMLGKRAGGGIPYRDRLRAEVRMVIRFLRGECELTPYSFEARAGEEAAGCDISSVTI